MSPGATRFTGERLHEGEALFELDLARHRAAYEFARGRARGARVLDLGCGGGAGAAALATDAARVVAVDRIAPDAPSRAAGARFVRGEIGALPLRAGRFDLVTSFQVIEHLSDPGPYLDAIGALLAPGGCALLSTPNRARSDGVNPFHVREYLGGELRALLGRHFGDVELLGVGTSPAVTACLDARSRRIRRVRRLDPLRLHARLPQPIVERAFALGARLVRRRGAGETPDATWRDFPIGPADDATSLDWLALCRAPRRDR